jgi:hypothetical protein
MCMLRLLQKKEHVLTADIRAKRCKDQGTLIRFGGLDPKNRWDRFLIPPKHSETLLVHYGLTLDLVNPAFLREKAGLFCNKAALLADKEGLRLIEYFETSQKWWRFRKSHTPGVSK